MGTSLKTQETLTTLKNLSEDLAAGLVKHEYGTDLDGHASMTVSKADDFSFIGALKEAIGTLKLLDKYTAQNKVAEGTTMKEFVLNFGGKVILPEAALIILSRHMELPDGKDKEILAKWGEEKGTHISQLDKDGLKNDTIRFETNDRLFGQSFRPEILEGDRKAVNGEKTADKVNGLEDHGMLALNDLKQVFLFLNNKAQVLNAGEKPIKINTEFLKNDDGTFSIKISQTNKNVVDHLKVIEEKIKHASPHLRIPKEYKQFLKDSGANTHHAVTHDNKGNIIINEPLAGVILQGERSLRDKLNRTLPGTFSERIEKAGLVKPALSLSHTGLGLGNAFADEVSLNAGEALDHFKKLLKKSAYNQSMANFEKTEQFLQDFRKEHAEKLNDLQNKEEGKGDKESFVEKIGGKGKKNTDKTKEIINKGKKGSGPGGYVAGAKKSMGDGFLPSR